MTTHDLLPLAAIEEELDPYLESALELEEAARVLDLEGWIVERLHHPEREITANLVLVRDNGDPLPVTAFRVQHSSARGPLLGGIRLSPHAQLSETRALAMNMTWQCALLDLPFGGSAGALVCDPGKLSERELRHLSKDYVAALRGILGPGTDVIMEDLGSNPQVLAWMLDAHARASGRLEPAAVAGKPGVLFGLPDHADAAAHGVFDALRMVVEEGVCQLAGAPNEAAVAWLGSKLAGQRIALQGFGRTGSVLARLLDEAGARLVAAADISGGVRSEEGLPVPALLGWVASQGVLLGFPGAESVPNAEVLEGGCDVLVLAAAPRQITMANAARIRAPLVIEAVEDAITPPAGQALEHRGAILVPALLAGAGATAAAYLEWSLNVGHEGFLLDGVEENIRLRMEAAYHEARRVAHRDSISLRRGALVAAVEKVAAALRLR
ncbi:MAG TPA: Glu/Leu/Phe/Val dehydrogenase dimerization domain-containing protein [Terriglobales bacterium]|nr:Glu/Leu/Phe/Val dehydrogenase dimerization domain-containing protein [Terriglobales bacterium]